MSPLDDPASTAARVRPFPVSAEVMADIRPMMFHDAPQVARLHQAAMGDSLWAKLGLGFLTQLYQALVNNPRFLGFVYEEGPRGPARRIRGFIAGSQDTEAMFREVRKTAWFLLLPVAAAGALRHPAVLPHLLQTARYFRQSSPAQRADVRAESLFCSFEPELRGQRVSGHINKVLFDELAARGHRYVKVTTEVDNEGANRQLQSWGFADQGRFRFYGKDMVCYVLDLQASPRVEAKSRHPSI